MKQISTGLIALSAFLSPVAQAYNAGSISFSIDNDGIVGTDQNYTNGVFLEFNSASTPMLDVIAPTPIRQVAMLLPLDASTAKGWNFRLGQQMWTPEDIESPIPVEGERPYAGLLFFETGIYQYSPAQVDKYSAMIGTVGPNSFAEQGQQFIHEIIGSDDPMGWDYQIENQVVFNLGYQGHRLINRSNAIGFDQYDLSSVGRINVGNYQSELALGSVVRWGNNLESNFGTTGFTPGKYVDISVLSSSPTGYYLFAGIEGRYRFNDITIDGDRPDEVPDTNVRNLQATIVVGGVYYQPKWGVSLSFASNTREFEVDIHTYSTLGSLELFWRI
ncbi:lipid A deacylase LpxR family protein [Photobacterium sp. SDRW27]|uniref:lipid A deacylase LpxR family protein n=1 Tax=Photobacterium obscurum TaxID=2829490 RepID=UPI00224425E4|nr:lipid A deacylase LpxR family protein [Photobacterium obscurum]MCW8329334.1 lipid A deacylase LpxR family protein [Photobacterium obscurum]